jgi:PAS domain S-box-containing protein
MDATEFEALYNDAPVGLALFDKNLRYIRVNEAMAEINGVPAKLHVGHTLCEVVPAIAAVMEPVFRSVIRTAVPVQGFEVSGETPLHPGERRTWLENVAPMRKDGQVEAILVSVVEITDRKRIEEEIAQRLQTEQLLFRELRHRIGNSMQIVSSILELQARVTQDDRAKEAFRSAGLRIRALSLIHSRLYRPELDFEAPDTAGFILGLCDDLTRAFISGARLQELEADVDPTVHLTHDQTVALGLIVTELVINACKYAHAPTEIGNVFVHLKRVEKDRARLTVGDDGKGVPPDFDPKKSGGLGMRIASLQAAQLGGALTVDHTPPGVTFHVAFPI